MFDIKQDIEQEKSLSEKDVKELINNHKYDQVSFIKGYKNSTEEIRDDLDSIGYDWYNQNERRKKQHYRVENVSQFNLYPNGPSHQVETNTTYLGQGGYEILDQLDAQGWEIVAEQPKQKSVAGSYQIFYLLKEDKYFVEIFVCEDENFINSIGKIISDETKEKFKK